MLLEHVIKPTTVGCSWKDAAKHAKVYKLQCKQQLNFKNTNYFLQVIPTSWHMYSDILSNILSLILSDIYSGIVSIFPKILRSKQRSKNFFQRSTCFKRPKHERFMILRQKILMIPLKKIWINLHAFFLKIHSVRNTKPYSFECFKEFEY